MSRLLERRRKSSKEGTFAAPLKSILEPSGDVIQQRRHSESQYSVLVEHPAERKKPCQVLDSVVSPKTVQRSPKVGSLRIVTKCATHSPRLPYTRDAAMDHKYHVTDQILGSGTTAVVKVAQRKDELGQGIPQSLVAAKVFKKAYMDDESCQLVQQEFELLKSISHPNIVKVYDFFPQPDFGCAYLFMQLIPGEDLRHLVQVQGAISEDKMRTIFHQLTSALSYLHGRRIIHRDVKPDNVIVENDLGRACLCDFNYARRLSFGGALTSRVGEKMFASPEMLLDRACGDHADVWGLGMCLYYALSGGLVPMFRKAQAETAQDLGMRLSTASPEQRCKWTERAGIPQDSPVVDVLYGCLSPKPSERPEACLLLEHPWLNEHNTTTSTEKRKSSESSRDHSCLPESAMAQFVERLCSPKNKKPATVGTQRAWSARRRLRQVVGQVVLKGRYTTDHLQEQFAPQKPPAMGKIEQPAYHRWSFPPPSEWKNAETEIQGRCNDITHVDKLAFAEDCHICAGA